MSDKKFTLIELHLDGDTQFGPRMLSDALPIGKDEASESEEDMDATLEGDEAEEDEGGFGAIGVVVGLVVLVGLVLAVKKIRGDDEASELEAQGEPELIVD